MDYLVIGAGPAGLQLGYFLRQAGRDYMILEAGNAPGTFPRHRSLISINKPQAGETDPERNLRMDWNSLLSDDPRLLFTRYTERNFPAADNLARFLRDFADASRLRILYDTRVVEVARDGEGFVAVDNTGLTYRARRLVVATGPARPYIPAIPGVEWAERYGDVSVDPCDFMGQRVLIIGKGDSAFETADNLIETAAVIHVAGPSSWRTHDVGHLRAVNNNFLDTYRLKSQNALLDGEVRQIEKTPDGYIVSFGFGRANEFVKELRYDRVILCTGFRFDDSIFGPGCRPNLVIDDRFPAQTSEWRSTNIDHLYFAGALMRVRDFKKSTSGFQYCIRALHRILEEKYHGVPWPHRAVEADPAELASMIIDRVNRTSALGLADLIVVGDGLARYYQEVPTDYVHDSQFGDAGSYFLVTLESGPGDAERAAQGRYPHPVVRHYRRSQLVATHHVTENPENDWTSPVVHRQPLREFIDRQLAGEHASAAVRV